MIVNISFTKVVFSLYSLDDDNHEIAYRHKGEMDIYDGRVTNARIAREIPKGAIIESVRKIRKRFYVDGEKALAWLIENGTEKT